MKSFRQMLWFYKNPKVEEAKWDCLNPPRQNPFKNYKTALRFLKMDIHRKTLLSNYEPTDTDLALLTLFKSKRFAKDKLNAKESK